MLDIVANVLITDTELKYKPKQRQETLNEHFAANRKDLPKNELNNCLNPYLA